MSAAEIADKLDDLLNPIAVKELRQAVKSRIVMTALMLFLFVQLAVLLLYLVYGERNIGSAANLHAGRDIFMILQGILLGTCIALVPLYAGIRLASERSDTNVDLLFISTLRPRGIIAGKFQASVVLILLIFSACAPFMTFTYLLRGIDIPSMILVMVLDFLVVLLGTQATIFLGSVPANLGLRLLLGLAGIGLLVALFSFTMTSAYELVALGLGSRLDTSDFWLSVAAVASAIVAAIGLLFTCSTALISPPSFNRALPVRLWLLGFWLVTGTAAALLTNRFRTPFPMYIWEMLLVVLLCAQIVVSINEREQWGLRIARRIPRRWWLRGPAFLLYSGAAGGVLFAVLLIALTLGSVAWLLTIWTDPSGSGLLINIGSRNTFALLLISLYTFDYCMTSVWLRNVFLSSRIKPSATWQVALVLFALGVALPWPLLFYFHNEAWYTGRFSPLWQLSNPFSTIYACAIDRDSNAEAWSQVFLIGWALAVLAGCLPWTARQLMRFHPPEV
ncbi:MAG: hypothetical protein ACYC3I_00770 [Gemmataceae bacterium]